MYRSISLASLLLSRFLRLPYKLHIFPKQETILHSQTSSEATATSAQGLSLLYSCTQTRWGGVWCSQLQEFVASMRFLHPFLSSSSICITFMRFLYLDHDPKLIPYPHLDRCYRTAYLIGTTNAQKHICTCNTEQLAL
jgi:hypothetical protein